MSGVAIRRLLCNSAARLPVSWEILGWPAPASAGPLLAVVPTVGRSGTAAVSNEAGAQQPWRDC
ncbi:hypothetical protein B0T26DRAFT_94941 [Lasiosphaeria miniovina]|uniref:Uncharacterized protein n=1 Tax=Lasiosphaeria miniovina TaxID=1954250 RepID=A0AA40ECL2_9PEZI|nr:uncharacterized protein B0T26DRAFT_94941 [Lasiosphaeria miniovina]KAK0735065.1 hypothetical protein B0T26DRAFT_94941 [Lasiosphaeria miniovina]